MFLMDISCITKRVRVAELVWETEWG